MKLSDKRFIGAKQTLKQERALDLYNKDQIRASVNNDLALEQAFDVLADIMGPNGLSSQPPMAEPGDVVDLGGDKWPEQDIQRVIHDLKQQGMEETKILQQLTDMGVLGTDRPWAQETEWLWSLIKTAQMADMPEPSDTEDSTPPSEPAEQPDLMEPGETPTSPELGTLFDISFVHNTGAAGSAEELSSILKSMGTSGIVEEVGPGQFKTDLPEELEHKLLAEGSFSVNIDKYMLSSGNTGQVTAVDDGMSPAGTPAAPMNGQRDSLSSPEIEGTGKFGQKLDPSELSIDPESLDVQPEPPSAPQDSRSPEVKQNMEMSNFLEALSTNPKALAVLPDSQKQAIAKSFITYVKVLEERYLKLKKKLTWTPPAFSTADDYPMVDDSGETVYGPLTRADKSNLRQQVSKMQGIIARAGNICKKLVKYVGQEAFQGASMPILDKAAQVTPPPPAAPPAEGAPGQEDPTMGMPPVEEMDFDDGRSLSDLLDDVLVDVQELKSRVESGETMSGGQDLEPISEDSGAMPAPPSKIAVDDDAKGYWESLYGDYGHQLADDRFNFLVDFTCKQSAASKVPLTSDELDNVVKFASCLKPAGSVLTELHDMFLIKQVIESNAYKTSLRHVASAAHDMLDLAIVNLPQGLATVYSKLAAKMKVPDVAGQLSDAVKLDKLEDKAEDHVLMPSHLLMTVTDKWVDGAYTKMSIEWNAKSDSANRSAKGMEQLVRSFVKGLESTKEFKNFGFMGQINVEEINLDGGTATVFFRCKSPADAVPHVLMTELK